VDLDRFVRERGGHRRARELESGRVWAENAQPEEGRGGCSGDKEAERGELRGRRPESRIRGSRRQSSGGERLRDRHERSCGDRRCTGTERTGASRAFQPVEPAPELGHDDLERKRVEAAAADLAVLHPAAYNS